MSDDNKPKQRAAYFTDEEYELVKKAAGVSDKRNLAHFINYSVLKEAKRVLK